jgi:TM2 domain-containing membrane protein YozV
MGLVNCPDCGSPVSTAAVACPHCGRPLRARGSEKSKFVAGMLAIFLGSFGLHKFYLNRPGWGLVYLLFCWTAIPGLVGLVEGLVYLFSSDEAFAQQYG